MSENQESQLPLWPDSELTPAEDFHDHCSECDCVLTGREGNMCCWCEERIEQAMADADMGTKIADMIFGKIPEKKE